MIMEQKEMSNEKKGQLIGNIIAVLRFEASRQSKPFDGGDTFFALCFKSDAELKTIAGMCGV